MILENLKQTQKLAMNLAGKIIKEKPAKRALILAMSGPLGSGKTSFVQGLAKGLGIEGLVKSPSFLLLRRYPIPKTKNFLIHIDCYRLHSFKDLQEIGFDDFLKDPQNIIALEWADKIKKHLPKKNILNINFVYKDKGREIEIK